ncbi:MAG: head GIN domain-containing protein [Bacteroidota bacterium]
MKALKLIVCMVVFAGGSEIDAQEWQERSIDDFDRVVVTGKIQVELAPGEENSLRIETTNVSPGKVLTDVSGSTLRIRTKPGIYSKANIIVKVSYVELNGIVASSGAHVMTMEKLTADKVSLDAEIGGKISALLAAEKLEAKSTEGGRIELEGKVLEIIGEANTGGYFQAPNLLVNMAQVKVTTGGIMMLKPLKELQAYVSTGGKLTYYGEPASVETRATLGGTIVHKSGGFESSTEK